ncbi:branched-chain amino acid ABC transporter permease [Ensifer sp. ENS08]|nr:branched-chain amino acid ABC transporter permease [Ensifer sp. ENS08]
MSRQRLASPLCLVIAGFLLLALVPAVASYLEEPFYIRFATRVMIMALAAVSLDLILGFGGMVCFGHAAFMGVGAYAIGIMAWHVENGEPIMSWPFVLQPFDQLYFTWPAAVAAAALVALVIGLISLRTSGLYFIMITLAFAQMLYYFFISLETYGGEDGLQFTPPTELGFIDLDDRITFYYVTLAVLAGCSYLVWRIVNSRFGMVIRGAQQNDRRMRAIGFSTYQYKLACFVISGAIAGLAGVMLAQSQQFVSPADMAWVRSSELITMVIVGGIGTVFGPIVGAATYLLLELVIGSYTTHWQVILGPILIFVVLFAKGGLASAFGALGGRKVRQ